MSGDSYWKIENEGWKAMAIDEERSGIAQPALSIEAFERLADAFGSDRSRWPSGRRASAEALLASGNAESSSARQVLAQARALERLLDTTRRTDEARLSSLTDRIVAAAGDETRARPVTAEPPQVVDLSAAREKRMIVERTRLGRNGWAAALLAASLLLGVFVGSGLDTAPAVQAAADAVGLGPYVDQLALGAADDTGQLHDEDVL